MMLRNLLQIMFGVFFGILCVNSVEAHPPLFTDDFQGGTLDNWVVGGRQAEGTNIANVVTRHNSMMGHLFKFSFTEINFSREFDYDPALRFKLDIEVTTSSTPPPADNFYGTSFIQFQFLDASRTNLGFVRYATATTPYIFNNQSGSTSHTIEIPSNVLQHLSLNVSEILSYINIDEAQITYVSILFNTYSSTRPSPSVTAELWVDNVCVDLGNACDAEFHPEDCIATYLNDGSLHIPCVNVQGPFGGTVMYEADMQLIPLSSPFAFELTDTRVK